MARVPIESSVATASSYATSITNGYHSITGVGAPQKDTVSRYLGNSDAHQAVDKESQQAETAGAKAVDFVQVLQGMASEFQTTDSEIAAELDRLSSASGAPSHAPSYNKSLFSEGGQL